MIESTLLRVAIITSILGLFSLFLVLYFSDVKSVESLNDIQLDDPVKIIGFIDKVQKTEDSTRLTISHQENIDVFVFDNIGLNEGSKVEVIGSVSEFQGKKEILVDKLTLLS